MTLKKPEEYVKHADLMVDAQFLLADLIEDVDRSKIVALIARVQAETVEACIEIVERRRIRARDNAVASKTHDDGVLHLAYQFVRDDYIECTDAIRAILDKEPSK